MMGNHNDAKRLKDGENKISADTHGLPVYYVEPKISSGNNISKYIQKFENCEKNNL